jgi:flagellar motor switch protein FliG
MYQSNELSNKQKAAILLIALGPEVSSQIFKHLKEDEMEKLTLEIANQRKVTQEQKEKVVTEFHQMLVANNYISSGGLDYAREILEKALGAEKAISIINRLTSSLQIRPFDFARKTDPGQLLNFIQNEHPQTIALIMSYLQADQSGAILSSLPPDRQVDVAKTNCNNGSYLS